jgi:tetratricopeptide (TPR) repeat protein
MFTVTFYSYKGGVGRTSALMNIAARLCALGKRVCVLDFDLEAPGLDSFGLPHPEEPMEGIVEYISAFLQTGKIPDIHDYIYEITGEKKGALFLIPAGKKDSDYQRALSHLDWKLLYKQKNGALLVEALRRIVARDYSIDYFLIDSRTGLTDVAGICTLQLPELVVLLFNLNLQNLNGTAQVYKAIRENRMNRSIRTLLVASPIPEIPEFLQLRSSRFNLARTTIGAAPELIIPYDPFVSFQEAIVDEHQSKLLSKAYDDLTQKIISQNEKDVINLLGMARELRETGEMQLAELKYQEIVELYPKSGEAWFEYGRFARINRDYILATATLKKAIEVLDDADLAVGELALTQLQIGELESARSGYLQLVENSDNIELLLRLSRTFADKGEPELALVGIARVVEKYPTAAARWSKAESLIKVGQFDEAREVFKKLAEESPLAMAIIFNAGYTTWKSGNDGWESFFQKAIAIFESSEYDTSIPRQAANIYGAIAFAYSSLGQTEKARRCLHTAVRLAEKVDTGLIFSFPEYQGLPKEAFIKSIEERLEKLESPQ